ncbi:BF3164 family lipoprotein [Muribaculum intestinale]|uniref:BF3164 family lipoprotein n=1 Tax=Muribaculum intestinale TaxID=1796646 RepID=UPI0025B15A6E|nr:BF3164 family lipoprotein [Muribaculum intestinale]
MAISIVAMTLLGFTSCSSGSRNDGVNNVMVDFDSVMLASPIGIPLDMYLNGDTVFITQFHGDTLLNGFSIHDGHVLSSAIVRGNGPGEVIGPISVQKKDFGIVVCDRQGFNLYFSEMADGSNLKELMSLPQQASSVFVFDNKDVLISKIPFTIDKEYKDNTRFTLYSRDGRQLDFGKYPSFNKNEESLPVEIIAHFHQTRGFCEVSDTLFAVSTSHTLSKYSKTEKGIRLISEVLLAPYSYSYNNATVTMSVTTKLEPGYMYGASYGLFHINGHLYVPFREFDKNLIIYCFDDDLNLCRKLIPKSSVSDIITIDENGRLFSILEHEDSYLAISKKVII